MFEIIDDAIDPMRLLAAVGDPSAGASVLFLGTTRNENVGRRVVRLEYEAFAGMATKEMRKLATQARRRWPLTRVAMVHRIGVVPVGESSVGIAVSAGHRTEAFEACHWLIDRLKEIVPIWKKEHFRGGTVWIGEQQGGPPVPATRSKTRRKAVR
ncbi:MAG TPA: molybdenum cofactor biosynthesis protein MoaE [Candidatus Binatia bacterium]|nr:molybdenum cofactor biosynthesis protein MoaE [Candidatus Binatia bacterium]